MSLTLLQQGKNIKLMRKLEQLESQSKLLNMSKLLETLLPQYDQDSNHNGRVRKWHEAEQFEKGIKGGVRSGKTFPIMAEAIGLSFVNRPEYHFSLSPTFANAIETVVEVLSIHCKRDGLAYDWVKGDFCFYIYWGVKTADTARILIHGMDMEWLGVTAASGDANEPFSIHRKAIDDWGDRISSPRAKLLRKLWGGTAIPETMQWGHEYFEHEHEINELLYTDTFATYGNIYLPKTYIMAQEKKYKGKQREVRLLGKCIRLAEGDAVYGDSYSDTENVKPFDMNDPLEYALSFDFNLKPMTCLMAGIKPDTLHICENWKVFKSKTKELCELVIHDLYEKGYIDEETGYTKHGNSLILTGDQTGETETTNSNFSNWQTIINEFEKRAIKIQPAVPTKNPSVKDSAKEAAEALDTRKTKHDPKCKDIAKTFTLTAWKPGAKGFFVDEQTEWGHHSACYRYLFWNTKALHMNESDKEESSSVSLGYRESRR